MTKTPKAITRLSGPALRQLIRRPAKDAGLLRRLRRAAKRNRMFAYGEIMRRRREGGK